jgi:hypothetical protein
MEKPLVTRHTAAWRIWNLRYHVKVPTLSQYSADYIRKNGVPATGDKKVDRERMNQLVDVKQTLAGLAIILSEGHPFAIMNREDCVQMYSDIQEHFRNWLDLTYSGLPPGAFPPIEDLRLLEMVALEIYAEAMRIKPGDHVNPSGIFERIMHLNRRRNLAAAERYAAKRIADAAGHLKPYTSMVDIIERYILED